MELSLSSLWSTTLPDVQDEEFVVVLEKGIAPHTRHVRGSNYCLLNVFEDRISGRAIIISVVCFLHSSQIVNEFKILRSCFVTLSYWKHLFPQIDNLVKGASGQALQNLNLMMGCPEDYGLLQQPLFPWSGYQKSGCNPMWSFTIGGQNMIIIPWTLISIICTKAHLQQADYVESLRIWEEWITEFSQLVVSAYTVMQTLCLIVADKSVGEVADQILTCQDVTIDY